MKKKAKAAPPRATAPKHEAHPAFAALAKPKPKAAKDSAAPPSSPRVASPAPSAPLRAPQLASNPLLGDGELFEQAVQGLADFDVHELKFSNQDEPRVGRRAPKSEREQAEQNELKLFEQMMSGTQRLPKQESKRVLLRQLSKSESHPAVVQPKVDEEASEALLSRSQRQLIERSRRQMQRDGELPSLMLRGLSREQAEERLLTFLDNSEGAAETGLARIITGKGLRSNDNPVLKPMCRAELERHSRVAEFAPEVSADGDFGAYIVRMKRRAKPLDEGQR